MKKITFIILAVVVIIGVYSVSKYNTFVTQGQAMDAQWAQVETVYQRRLDLIPNLVNSVKGVMKQEQAIFMALAEARSQYAGATTPEAKAAAANQVETSLGRLIAIVENYPQLKSSETVQTLMSQLEGSENRISVERGRYNEVVRGYNTGVSTFPSSVVARMFGFGPRAYFQADKSASVAPQVNF